MRTKLISGILHGEEEEEVVRFADGEVVGASLSKRMLAQSDHQSIVGKGNPYQRYATTHILRESINPGPLLFIIISMIVYYNQ